MNEIWNEVLKAIGILIGAGLIVFAYQTAKNLTKDSAKGLYASLTVGLATCAVLGVINASNVGQPTCLDSETDDYGTVCNEYADDGYEPSFEEQASIFAFWVVVTIVPIGLGINAGFKERKESYQEK